MSACTCPCPECGHDEDPMVHITGVRYHASAMDAAQAETRRLTAALNAAERQIIRMSQPEYSADGLADGDRIDQLTAALDAAQDEIEKLLSDKETLREQAMPSKESMMSAIHTVLHPTCDQPDDCIVDIYTAEDIIFAITGGAS